MSSGLRAVVAASAIVLTMGGCLPYATGGEGTRPDDPLPERFAVASGDERDAAHGPGPSGGRTGRAARPAERERGSSEAGWWRDLGDETLDELVAKALASAPDLEAAQARLEKARALAAQAQAPLWPQLEAYGQASYSETLSIFGTTSTMIRASAGVEAGWELDLFARFRARARAADRMAQASRFEVEAARLALAAETADAWFGVQAATARLERVREQLALDREQFELVEARYRRGLVGVLDLHQQRGQLVASEGELAAAEEERRLAVRRLAVLVGFEAAERAARRADGTLAEPSPLPSSGVPADLLTRRPDLRAARRRIQAADLQVGASIADWFPSVRLGARPAYTYLEPDLGLSFPGAPSGGVDGFEWSAQAEVRIPLFDGFRRYWGTRAAKADLRAAVAGYERLLRRAVVEVESAMLRERQARRRLEALSRQREVADATLQAARDRYRQGLIDYLPVLQALQARHRLHLAELGARLGLLRARIALHKALGGAPPEPTNRDASGETP